MPTIQDLYKSYANFWRDQGLPEMKVPTATPGLLGEDPQGLLSRQVLNNITEMFRPFSDRPEKEAVNVRASQTPSLAPSRDLEKWGQMVKSILSPTDPETGMPNVDLGVIPLTKGGIVKDWVRKLKFPSSEARSHKLWNLEANILDIPPAQRDAYTRETFRRLQEPIDFVINDPSLYSKKPNLLKRMEAHADKGVNTLESIKLPPPPLFSQTLYAAERLKLNKQIPEVVDSRQLKGLLMNAKDSKGNLLGVKQEELDWLGIDDIIKGKPKISKDELISRIRSRQVHVEEVRGIKDGGPISLYSSAPIREDYIGKPGSTADFYNQYDRDSLKTPGGTNYKEYLYRLTNPKSSYIEPHFTGPINEGVIAHIRTQDFTTASGKSAKHIEEAQSTLAHQLHKDAEATKDPTTTWEYVSHSILRDKGIYKGNLAFNVHPIEPGDISGLPKAPLAQKFYELAAKRSLQLTAEEGKDLLTWTTGEQQARRHEKLLLENISKLEYDATRGSLKVYNPSGNLVKTIYTEISKLPQHIGQDLSEKLLRNLETFKKGYAQTVTPTTATLNISPQTIGSGKNFERIYDVQFKKEVEKWVKKFGGEVKMDKVKVGIDLTKHSVNLNTNSAPPYRNLLVLKSLAINNFGKSEQLFANSIAESTNRSATLGEGLNKTLTRSEFIRHANAIIQDFPTPMNSRFIEILKNDFGIIPLYEGKDIYKDVWSATITPAMRDAILPSRGGKGLPLFGLGAGAALIHDRTQKDKQ
jgi:hypothetical protein